MSIKIKRSVAVALMVAFDFPKASEWDNDKLVARLAQVPEKVDAADVPEEFKALYQELSDAKGVVDLQDDTEGKEKPAKAEKKGKPAAKESKKNGAVIRGPGEPKPAKVKKVAKVKAPKEEVKRDEHGVSVDSDAGKVNAALKKGWQTEDEIVEATGLELKSVRRRLRRAARKGWAEKEKLIRYRLPSVKE